MGFRVADPNRLRIAALVATLFGAVWVIFAATRGAVLLLGLPVMGLGVAGFDLARHGRASMRQIALVVTIVAAGLAMWAFFVIVFIRVLDDGGASWSFWALLLVSVALAAGGFMILRRPRIVSTVSSAVSGGGRARKRTRPSRGRHAPAPTRAGVDHRAAAASGERWARSG